MPQRLIGRRAVLASSNPKRPDGWDPLAQDAADLETLGLQTITFKGRQKFIAGSNKDIPKHELNPQSINAKDPLRPREGIPPESETPNYVDILSAEARKHILNGDGPESGGHMWPGQQGKSNFPHLGRVIRSSMK
ncbi:hypothetical protein [Xanthomonas euvesicatoria]|uniref:hypothetical protein n=1 Tax=Xanthomonas euvesicatoria TaxID=456327 RepID=UPI001E46D0BE|nr:hypothetical protein [Xanthomonas euvesicatoria]